MEDVPAKRTMPVVSLANLRYQIETMPAHPRSLNHPYSWWFRTKRAADFLGHINYGVAQTLARMNPYPKPFRHVRFPTEDGVDIAGWLGPQHPTHESDWGIVVVPGMFATKDDTVHKSRAIRMHRQWRIPVLAIDMRAFGESMGIATAGWKEAYDVHGAARYLIESTGVDRVAILSESMGGAAALNALALDATAGTHYFGGGALCFSAFVDAKDAVEHISTPPPRGDPFRSSWDGFRKLLRMKSGGAYDRFDDFLEDSARVNGLPGLEELLRLANPKWKANLIQAPTMLVHATDDPVVPVRHARRMERYADEKPNVEVVVTNWGQHTQFEALDEKWFWEACAKFYGFVNGVELPNLA